MRTQPYATVALLLLTLILSTPSWAAAPQVVATLKPIHSLVSGVMRGVGRPQLLIDGSSSPHGFSLRPSQARMLSRADLIFWVGEDLERFMHKPLKTLAKKAKPVSLMQSPGIHLLALREGGMWEGHAHEEEHDHDKHAHEEEHDHDKHAHEEDDDHDKHAHEEDDDHDKHAHEEDDDLYQHAHEEDDDHDKHAHEEEHDHDKHAHEEDDDHDKHGEGEQDAHIWLDPDNAQAMVRHIGAVLSKHDPEHASQYQHNVEQLTTRLEQLKRELAQKLAPVINRPYLVFHDAYHYFEHRFGLSAVGSITLDPERKPSAKRLMNIRAKIIESRVRCIFTEPQFEPSVVQAVIRGRHIRQGELDPLGSGLDAGPDSYFELLRSLGSNVKACLGS
uniref:High-affinity zinc uptake system protein ZnuA n=1 Tax=Magnetococcus massalia (strain MO-1) TaxID=451514 RepID=A0A1S7LGR7_MAGMO|nr:High-affinity zinc uptake system protein znuA [Candidatus Magnetococcus massalia]